MNAVWPFVAASALLLGGCSERSKLDELAQVDVCGLLPVTQLSAWWGELDGAPQPIAPQGMHAGACRWVFSAAPDKPTGSLDLMVVTPAVAGHNPYLDKWFETSQNEVSATLGAKAVSVPKLGHQAFFYDSPRSRTSQLWVRQGKAYLVFSAHAIDSARLLEAGQMVSESIKR